VSFLLKKQRMIEHFSQKSFLKKLSRYQYFRGHYFKKRVLQFKLSRYFVLPALIDVHLKAKSSFFDILKKKIKEKGLYDCYVNKNCFKCVILDW